MEASVVDQGPGSADPHRRRRWTRCYGQRGCRARLSQSRGARQHHRSRADTASSAPRDGHPDSGGPHPQGSGPAPSGESDSGPV